MNNIYRVIWNASISVWQAVSEIGRSGGKTQSVRKGAPASVGGQGPVRSFAATALMMACAMAHADPILPVQAIAPQGAGVVTSGSAMTITQTQSKAVLNWQSFNVGSGSSVEFVQPSATAIALNRVVGVSGSKIQSSLIEGSIKSNGIIFLTNPAGITFTKGASVDVGGIIASTRELKMTDQAFLDSTDDKYTFTLGDIKDYKARGVDGGSVENPYANSKIENYGSITASAKVTDSTSSPGYVVLISNSIKNAASADGNFNSDGWITGKNIALVSGDEVTVNLGNGIPAIVVDKSAINGLIENHGWISSTGQVVMTAAGVDGLIAAAINNTGVIEAQSISISTSGTGSITLDAASSEEMRSIIPKSILKASESDDGTPAISIKGGDVKLGSRSEVLTTAAGGTISVDGGKIILEADAIDPTVKSKVSSSGNVEFKGSGIDSNGLIESSSSPHGMPQIVLSGPSIKLGKESVLQTTFAGGSIKLTSEIGSTVSNAGLISTGTDGTAKIELPAGGSIQNTGQIQSGNISMMLEGPITNSGSLITGNDGATGTVTLTAASIVNEATGKVKSGDINFSAATDITLNGTDANSKSELRANGGSVTLSILDNTSTGTISNDGLIETAANADKTIVFTGAKSIALGANSELKAKAVNAAIDLSASTGDVSNAGSIITGEDGSTGTVVLTATAGNVMGAATGKILSGTITLDAGKGIDLKGTDALIKSQLKASVGSVTLKATEAISNDGLIETAANADKTIVFTGAKSIKLGANSELKAKAVDAAIDLKASAGIISNAGSIITGEDGNSGTVTMTALAGDITNSATGMVKSGTITLRAFNIDFKAVPPTPVFTSFAITNDGKIETSAAGQSISMTGKSITLGTTSKLKSKAAESSINLMADSGDIKNAGSIITDADGETGSVMMTAGVGLTPIGSIKNAATGVVKSGAISMAAQNITLEATDADHKSQLIASQGPVSMKASGNATIDGLVQSKAADGGVITLNAANILLKANALLDASGNVAGAVTTNAAFKLDAEDGAQVKTLSSEDPTKLGTWTASAADVHVRTVVVTEAVDPSDDKKTITTTGPSGVDLAASSAGVIVTRVNLLDQDQMVDASPLVGDFSKVQKAAKAKANGIDPTTELIVTQQGWNIVVDEAMKKPEAAKTTVGSAKDTPVPQDVTLTLKSGRDIHINEEISSDYGRGRLNLVLTAEGDVSIGDKGRIVTNGGNFYVGEVTAANSITAMDTVSAKGRDFVMKAGAAINVDAQSYGGYGGYGDGNNGAVIVSVSQDIKLQEGSTITKSNTSGYNNAIKKTVYNSNAWGYFYNYRPFGSSNYSLDLNSGRDVVVGGNVLASNTTVNVNAGRDILAEAGGRIQSAGYATTVNINAERNIGSSSQSLRIDADLPPTYPVDPFDPFDPFFPYSFYPSTPATAQTLNVFNNTGASYIRNETAYYKNITLTTTTKTDGVQSIVMADGRQVVATAAKAVDGGTPSILTIDTGGVKVDDVSNLTITSPNMILKPGAISSLSGETPVSQTGPNADPSYKAPTGSNLTLTAQTEGGDYGFIKASEAAKLASPADGNREIMVPNGTVTLNALNIGTESAISDAAKEFKQALEIDSTSLNVNNYGGSTWIANSSYNTLTFKMLDAAGAAAGSHHILSTNGDFFNVESTSNHEMVVYSIDRAGLAASTDPLSITPRMSGIYTRATDGAHKNVTLDTGSGGSSRDLIFMDDAVDLGAATLSLTAQSGKSIQGYSSKLLQQDATVFGTAAIDHKILYKNGAAATPHLTVGNLIMTATNSGSTIGGNGYDLKVAKGGVDDQINAATNKLTINNQSGDIALHELSAKHFKDISITDSNWNVTHKVAIDLFHNQDVKEQLNYTDTKGGALTFDKTSVVMSGYNRNLTLNLDNKKVEIGGFGTADGKVTSGDFTVNASTLKLGGDITTTHRANDNVGFDRGNVKFRASSYTLTDNVKIDTNTTASDLTADDNKVSSGNIKLESRGFAAPISGHGFSLTVNAMSNDPVTVAGGNIKADVVAAGTSGDAMRNLSFTSNTVDGKGGLVEILGNKFLITGDFKASGTVKMNGATSTTWGGESDFRIATNVGGGNSGAITFDGTSFTLNKGYGTATIDASSATGQAGNITLWDSSAGDKHSSSLSVGKLVVDATGVTNGEISVDNITTTGRSSVYFTTSGYTDASQTYTADKVTLGGNLFTKSGDVNVLAQKEVVVANDVKIQTFAGNPDESNSKIKTGTAGDVTLGDVGAKLTATGQTLEVDASAGRKWVSLVKDVVDSSYTPTHGLITINDSTASAGTEFKNLTLIGTNVVGDITKYTTTNQMTLGLLDQATAGWSNVKAGSLLLLGQNTTDYTFDKANIGKLAADAIGKLKVTATSDVTVAPLSYAGTFEASPNGIKTSADIQVSGSSLTVAENALVQTYSGKIDLSSSSTASDKGIVLKDGSQVTSYGGANLTTAGGDIQIGQGVSVQDSNSVSLTAAGSIKIADEADATYPLNLGSVTSLMGSTSLNAGQDIDLGKRSTVSAATDVTLVADGAIITGGGSRVISDVNFYTNPISGGGNASLTAGQNIELGESSAVSSTMGNVTLSAKGDIKLGDYSSVQSATGVTITATKNTDTDPVKNGDVVLGSGVTVQSSTSGTTANDVTITAAGAIKLGVGSNVSSNYGSLALTAGADIEVVQVAADPIIAPFSVLITSLTADKSAVILSAKGDINLPDFTNVMGATGVTIRATKNDDTIQKGDVVLGVGVTVQSSNSGSTPNDVTITADGSIKVGAGSNLSSNLGNVALKAGTDITLGEGSGLVSFLGTDVITPQGQIKIGSNSQLISSGAIKLEVTGEGSIEFAQGASLVGYSSSAAHKISTGTGDITFAGTASNDGANTAEWLVISAGSSKKKEDATGGNVIFTGGISSSSGRAVIYTGSADKAEETPDSYIDHYTLGSYVYGRDSTDNKPDFSNVPGGSLAVAFRQKAGDLRLSIPAEKVYNGKTWVNEVTDVATQEQLALDVNGLRKWESAYVDAKRGPASAYDYLATNQWIPTGYSLKSESGELKNVGDYKVKFENNSSTPVVNPVGYGVSAPGGEGATVDFKITPKELTVNVQAKKIYDGNDIATLDKDSYSLSGFVMAESATVSKTTGTFNSKNVAGANSVTTTLTATDFTPDADSGFLATNYSYKVVAGQGAIAAKKLGAVALNPANTVKKVYDGNSTANLTGLLDFTFDGLVTGESMSVGNGLGQFGSYRDGVFVASKNVLDVNLVQVLMSNPTYTMGAGTLASNYRLPTVIQSEMKGQITARQLLATAKAEDKLFDGKADAKAVIALAKPSNGTGVVGNDQVSLAFRSAEFVDSQVGVNKQVFLRDPFAQGADSDNYVVSFDGEFPAKDVTTQASIRPLNLSPVVMAPPAPVPVVIAPPNFSNGPVQSIGGMGVVNVESSSQSIASAGDAGGMTAVTIESLLANQAGAPNQVYVVDGGIKFEKSDK